MKGENGIGKRSGVIHKNLFSRSYYRGDETHGDDTRQAEEYKEKDVIGPKFLSIAMFRLKH